LAEYAAVVPDRTAPPVMLKVVVVGDYHHFQVEAEAALDQPEHGTHVGPEAGAMRPGAGSGIASGGHRTQGRSTLKT
jgi:hypothetical protein